MAKKQVPENQPDAVEKVEAKLKLIDEVGKLIFKYIKKWILAIVGILTAASIYFGYDFFGAIGIKNPATANSRHYKHHEHTRKFYNDLEELGHFHEDTSEYYLDDSVYEDSTYVADTVMYQELETSYDLEIIDDSLTVEHTVIKDTVVIDSLYIVDQLYDLDLKGDTFYIDVYSDGTDSVYYPNKIIN